MRRQLILTGYRPLIAHRLCFPIRLHHSNNLKNNNKLLKHHNHAHIHSHGHLELLTTKNLKNPAVQITLLGLLANASMAVTKGIGGVVFHSQSLIADAIHAVSDLLSDLLTLATVSVAKKKATHQFPHGYGRVETLGAFGVSSMLLFAGASMGISSLNEILISCDVEILKQLHLVPHNHHNHAHVAEWSAALVALGSIVVKETLYRLTRNVAKQQNSPVLYANAWHHRVDCLVSVVAVVSICVGQLFQLAWVDPLGGLLVSLAILRAGWQPSVDAVYELCGGVKSTRHLRAFGEFRQRAVTELRVLAPQYMLGDVRLEPYGSTYVGVVELRNVQNDVNDVAGKLKAELMKMDNVKEVTVCVTSLSTHNEHTHNERSEL